jgi:alpha-L-fucosidase 2
MKRYQINILRTIVLLGTIFLVTFRAPAQHKGGNKGSAGDDIQTVTSVVNEKPAERWEEYFISGNGTMGIMVGGEPYNETIVINHEKLYVPLVNVKREATYTAKGWEQARKMAKDGQYAKAYDYMIGYYEGATSMMWDDVNFSPPGRLPREDVHPGLNLCFTMNNNEMPQKYEREMVLNTGEIVVRWEDKHGKWERKAFVSRPHNLIVISMKAPEGVMFSGSVCFAEAPGREPDDLGSVTIEHHDDEMYFHAAYNYTHGKPQPEGYHCLAQVVCTGGSTIPDTNKRIVIKDANEVLILARISDLDPAGEPDADHLLLDLADIPADYEKLLQKHAIIHGEMFSRVKLDLGSGQGYRRMGKWLVEKSVSDGATAEMLEAVHALGRYTLISSSGELPPHLWESGVMIGIRHGEDDIPSIQILI